MKFLCGASRENITPSLGTHLYGYTPHIICDEVHDSLYASAIAFADCEKRLLLVSVDSGDLNTALFEELRADCAKVCEIDEKNIIITATHTHCAPNLSGFEGWGAIDRKYFDGIFRPAVLKASEAAFKRLAKSEISICTGESRVGINRRECTEDFGIALGQNPWGAFDPQMTVIKIRNAETKAGIVNLVHYGCHGTACGASTIVTRDWYGVMLDLLEEKTETLSVFINGAIGDVGPRLTNGQTVGDISHVEELGNRAGLDALKIIEQDGVYTVPEIKCLIGEIALPYKELPRLSEVQKQLSEIKNPEKLFNFDGLRYHHLKEVEALLTEKASCKKPRHFKFPVSVFAVGDICIIPYPYEMFAETTLRLRKFSPYAHTLCLSCANGYNGYLPSQDQLCRGGYEVDVFKYGSLYPLGDNTDDTLIKQTLKIIKEID